MALTDFFRINFPYGIQRNDTDEWFAFNREYMPLGTAKKTAVLSDEDWKKLFVGVRYNGLTDKLLTEIAAGEPKRDDTGKIYFVTLYKDGSNPMNDSQYWDSYSKKLKKIGRLKIKFERNEIG